MGFFKRQLKNVIEWDEFRDDMIFYKWHNDEIKRDSKLIIRPGQDAIFMYNGKIEGIFEDEGTYEVSSEIVPFLSTLKGFKFGFDSGIRAEVLFVNTKEFTIKWGTKNPINIPTQALPGGMPIRANGTLNFKVKDYVQLIDNVAGVKNSYLVNDVSIRITSVLDQLLMKWIVKEGKDMFHLQANSFEIGKGIKDDLDMQLFDIGMTVTGFNIVSFNYPKEIQDMITKNASFNMVGDVSKYQQVSMTDGIASGKVKGGGVASDMTGMMMGMNVAKEMMDTMKESNNSSANTSNQSASGSIPNFCPNCGAKTGGANFCSNCGHKLA
ncbi:MAG TPA: hypothetical protein GX705_08355 [Clostridiales bacterium]|nr:hypothetical protein [Clostridiales bacterium]